MVDRGVFFARHLYLQHGPVLCLRRAGVAGGSAQEYVLTCRAPCVQEKAAKAEEYKAEAETIKAEQEEAEAEEAGGEEEGR